MGRGSRGAFGVDEFYPSGDRPISRDRLPGERRTGDLGPSLASRNAPDDGEWKETMRVGMKKGEWKSIAAANTRDGCVLYLSTCEPLPQPPCDVDKLLNASIFFSSMSPPSPPAPRGQHHSRPWASHGWNQSRSPPFPIKHTISRPRPAHFPWTAVRGCHLEIGIGGCGTIAGCLLPSNPPLQLLLATAQRSRVAADSPAGGRKALVPAAENGLRGWDAEPKPIETLASGTCRLVWPITMSGPARILVSDHEGLVIESLCEDDEMG